MNEPRKIEGFWTPISDERLIEAIKEVENLPGGTDDPVTILYCFAADYIDRSFAQAAGLE